MIELETPYWMSGKHICIFYAKNRGQLIGAEFFKKDDDGDFLFGCADFWNEEDIRGKEAPRLVKKKDEIEAKRNIFETLFIVGDRYLK